MIDARPERPPSPETSATYGVWPNERSRTTVPPSGSLVGHHTVQGDYSPQIDFTLGPDHDFLGPLNLSAGEKTPAGATRLTWASVGGATGYFAFLVGGGGPGQSGYLRRDVVLGRVAQHGRRSDGLSSSGGSAAADCRARRSAAHHDRMSCPGGNLRGHSRRFCPNDRLWRRGEFHRPAASQRIPRTPWNLKWTVKVRFKSTAGAVLGMNMPANRAPRLPAIRTAKVRLRLHLNPARPIGQARSCVGWAASAGFCLNSTI